MRSLTSLSLALLLSMGCGEPDPADPADSGEADPDPTDTDVTDTAPPTGDDDDDTTTSPSSFVGGQYRIDALTLYETDDVDNDGTIDNNLANALNLLDVLIASNDFSVPTVNDLIADSLSTDNILLLDAENGAGGLSIGMLYAEQSGGGIQIDPDSMDLFGEPKIVFEGSFLTDTEFEAGPADMQLPITFIVGAPPVQVLFVDVQLAGTLDAAGAEGELYGVVPIDVVVNNIASPMIPDEGYDLDGDGVNETKQEIVDLIWSIAPAAGDVDLGGGATGVSATFHFIAVPQAF